MKRFSWCWAAVALLAAAAFARVPQDDSRNSDIHTPNTRFAMPYYGSRAAWEQRRAYLRGQILSAAGLLPMPARTPLRTVVARRIEHPGYTVEALLLETLPGYYLGGNLYRPTEVRKRGYPAVLVPHGHWNRGRLENQPSYSVPALCIALARQGYVAFAYDMVGYNDTRQTSHNFGGPAEQLWSFNPLGLQLWNSIRAVDYLQSLWEVDPNRIAVTGASGGGTQTFLLAAVDDRIRFAAPVNMVSASMQGGDPCEEAPNLRVGTFNVEIAAMMAPRPLLLVSATGDWTRNTPTVEFPAIRNIYELYGASEAVANVHMKAEHNYNRASRENVYVYLARYLRPGPQLESFAEGQPQVDKDEDLLAVRDGRLPAGALDYEGLFRQWKSAAQLQTEQERDLGALRERLSYALGAEWPQNVIGEGGGTRFVLTRPGKGDRVSALWTGGSGEPVLLVHPDGIEAARQLPVFAEMQREGRPVLTIDAFQTGASKGSRDRQRKYFLSYNQSDDANRVQDILTGLRFLEINYHVAPRLIGAGRAGIWALFAAAAAPIPVSLAADIDGFSGSDADFIERFFVPGIQRAGGLPAALRLAHKFRAGL